ESRAGGSLMATCTGCMRAIVGLHARSSDASDSTTATNDVVADAALRLPFAFMLPVASPASGANVPAAASMGALVLPSSPTNATHDAHAAHDDDLLVELSTDRWAFFAATVHRLAASSFCPWRRA